MLRTRLVFMQLLLSVALISALGSSLRASDHIDGEITKTEPLADLSDFYAFPSRGGDAVSLILNTYPIAHSDAHFSARISYAFEIRAAQVAGKAFRLSDGLRIECSFQDEHDEAHSVTCATDTGLKVGGVENEVGLENGLGVFFGRRSDPFFFNSDWATATSTTGQIAESDGENTMDALNALSLAVQIDRSLLPGQGMLALAVGAFTDDDGQARFLDRIGRPEITNVTLIHRAGDEDIRDDLNRQPAFGIAEDAIAKKRQRLAEAIRYYDALDGQADWSDVSSNALVQILSADHLMMDPSKPCEGDRFFEIERAVLEGQPHESCGGRKPGDDLIDRLYSLYIAKDREIFGDGVDAPQTPTSGEFPHLAPPERGLWTWFKTWLGNRRAR